MKILLVNYRYFYSGGSERYMVNIIDELKAHGHEVIVFSSKNNKNFPSPYSSYFVRNVGNNTEEFLFEHYQRSPLFYYDYLTRELYSYYVRKKIRRLIRDTQPDICYMLHHKVPLSPSIIDELKKNGVPVVHRVSDYNIICPNAELYQNKRYCTDCFQCSFSIVKNKCIKQSLAFSWLRYLSMSLHKQLRLYKKIDRIITTNDFARTRFLEAGFAEQQVVTVRTFGKDAPDNIQKNYQWTRPMSFLHIGNIGEAKGTYDLIEACNLLVNQYQQRNFFVTICGGLRGGAVENAQRLVDQYNLNDVIRLTGSIEATQTSFYYQQADVTIIPGRGVDNLPNVLIESLLNHTPVLAPDFGSVASCTDEEIAWYYQFHNIPSLANTMNQIIQNPTSVGEKSQQCASYANRHFNRAKHIEQLISIFESVIKS